LPAPFRHAWLKKYGGEMADPFLLVKYAVRYKAAGETVAVRAYPMVAASVAEVLDAEPLAVDEAGLATEAVPGIRYAELPAWLASAGAKGVEKALKERLADKLAVKLWSDPATKATSKPGEDKDAFAARLTAEGGGAVAEKLEDKLDKLKRDLAGKEQELSGRKTEKWAAVGSAILSNIGLFTGRKRTITGAGSVLTKNRLENTAEAKIDALKAEIAGLEADLAGLTAVDADRFQAQEIVPARSDVKILRYDLVWVY
jgi:hypothetical protein